MSIRKLRSSAMGTPLRLAALTAMSVLLLGLTVAAAQAYGRTEAFTGNGSGTSAIINPDECDDTGECDMELRGEFDAGDMGIGTVNFKFSDDWSDVTGRRGSCSVPVANDNATFIWESADGDALVMTQTLGFACPTQTGETWNWKRALSIVEGTGKFDGASGTVFVSGIRKVDTGAETWTFDGSVTFPIERTQRDGCYRAYFIGNLIVIPPKDTPPPVAPSLSFWLCGDDVTLQGPNPRENYEIFNPIE